MDLSISSQMLREYVSRQINCFFPDRVVESSELSASIGLALDRAEKCFSAVNSKYFTDGHSVRFNHLNGDQYSMFLYLLANSLFKLKKESDLCVKAFALNKLLHGIDAFYEVELPDYFLFVHPLGTVLGRGMYSNFLVVYQRCGVGANHGIYPRLGEYVSLFPGSSVLGDSTVGSHCSISTGSIVLDQDVPQGSIYIGQPKNFTLKKSQSPNSFWKV